MTDGEKPKDEDDLLSTIRTLVSEELHSDAKPPPLALVNPSVKGAPLVLGAAARVGEPPKPPEPPAAPPPKTEAPIYDEPALRSMIGGLVREELSQIMADEMEERLRHMVRSELIILLADARDG